MSPDKPTVVEPSDSPPPLNIPVTPAPPDDNSTTLHAPSIATAHSSTSLFARAFRFKSPQMIVFVVLFGLVGGYIIFKSFAATPAANPATHQAQFEGQLQILHKDDFKGKNSEDAYALVSNTGVSTAVDFQTPPPDYNGTARVKLKGTVKSGRIQVASAKDTTVEQITSPAQTPHKTAVVLFNYTDNTSQPITASAIDQEVFTGTKSANAFFQEESYGQRSLVGVQNPTGGDVFGYYTISAPSSVCDEYTWANEADAAALADGHDLSAYDNVIYIAGTTGCAPYGGFGEVGGRRSWVFINSTYIPSYVQPIIQHEVTHNFGTWHANGYDCVDQNYQPVAISDDCQFIEYSDPLDIMGYNIYSGHTYHSNNYFLHDLGFLPTAKTIYKSGDYTLTPVDGATPSTTPVIRLIRSIDQYNDYQYLYLEYRQPYGFDDFAPTDPTVNGTLIRVSSGYDGYIKSGLIFPNLKDINRGANPAMQDGDVFSDPTHNIKITQVSHTTAGVKLHIDVSNVPKPDTTPPSAPTNLKLVSASTHFITITGTTSPESDVASYRVYRGTKLAGWAYGNGSAFTYTDTQKFTPGTVIAYTVKAADFAGNISTASAPLNVTVPVADTIAPTAPKSLTGFLDSTTNVIPVVYLNWQPATDNRAVAGYMVFRVDSTGVVSRYDMRMYGVTPTDTSFQDWYRASRMTYTYYIKAYDSDLNYSKPSNKIVL